MKKRINDFKFDKEYTYSDIHDFVDETDGRYIMNEYGVERIGEHFIVIGDTVTDAVVSFVLSGTLSTNYVYRCVYSDF